MRLFSRALVCALVLLSAPALADDISNGSYNTLDGSNNAAPPNGWPAGMFPNQVEPTARANMGATKRWWERANAGISTTGSAGAYVLTPSNTSYPTAYTQGEVVCAKANFTSVGNDTLNYNSLGAKALYVSDGSSLTRIAAGLLLSGQQFCVSYDSALNSGAGGWQFLGISNTANFLTKSGNLSGLANTATARTNLGLGDAATHNVTSNNVVVTVSSAATARLAAFSDNAGTIGNSGIVTADVLTGAGNLSGLGNTSTARSNLGLGSQATKNITVSTSGPSGSANNGDVWLQY